MGGKGCKKVDTAIIIKWNDDFYDFSVIKEDVGILHN